MLKCVIDRFDLGKADDPSEKVVMIFNRDIHLAFIEALRSIETYHAPPSKTVADLIVPLSDMIALSMFTAQLSLLPREREEMMAKMDELTEAVGVRVGNMFKNALDYEERSKK